MLKGIAVALLIFNGLGAVMGGLALMLDSSGRAIGMPVELLEHSPFENYFIPGLILFSVIGIGSLVAAQAGSFRWKKFPWLVTAEGAALVTWIGVQITMLRTLHWVQLVYGLIGIGILASGIGLVRTREAGQEK